jgi:hypothetical protein
MRGGFQEEGYDQGKTKDSTGIIPVTARIIKNTINNDLEAEFKGVKLRDVVLVGNLIEVEEKETRVLVKIWDHTGTISAVFFNRSEMESLSDLQKLAQDK